MVETIVIIALVAIGTIGALGVFGNDIRRLFGSSSQALAGQDQVTNPGKKPDDTLLRKTMSNFGYNPAGSENNPE